MIFTQHYESPLGGILLAADDIGLTGLWFEGQKYFARTLDAVHQEQETAVLSEARRWLDVYFGGQEPDFTPPLHPAGSAFQQEVWALLRRIPCGQTTTYGALAKQLAAERGLSRMSAQAVGGAVGHNVISIIIPCHRVVGTDGSLTGYAGGIDKKAGLLLYTAQLVVNFFWTIFFFNLEWRLFSFFWLLLLLGLVIAMIVKFSKDSKPAAYLQIPYALWLLFAGYLNLGVYLLNRA